jgi:hypothetical protein
MVQNVEPKLYWKSLRMELPFAHRARAHHGEISDKKEIDDGQYSADHHGFISWKPTTLKHAIDSSGPILSIKHLGVVGFHHAAAAATGKHRHGVSTMRRAFK